MTDLNEAVLPSVWSMARHAILRRPGLSRDDLHDAITPREIIDRAGPNPGESRHVRPSVAALMSIGILEEDDQGLHLTAGEESEVEFRRAVTRLVFIPAGGPDEDVWRLRTERQPEHHAELALAWLHLQGVNSPSGPFPAATTLLQSQFGPDRVVLRDTAPFNAFERLARWCGVAAPVNEPGGAARIVPDLTEALRAELDDITPPKSEVPARQVIDRVSEIFPWLPTGQVGRAVRAEMADTPDESLSQGTVPEGLSLALVQLHHEGLIELVAGDDASDRVTLAPGGIADSAGREVAAIARVRRPKASA